MTKLDAFKPKGITIHPYDVYALLSDGKHEVVEGLFMGATNAIDDADWQRNRHKIGSGLIIDGVEYWQTTAVPYKTDILG